MTTFHFSVRLHLHLPAYLHNGIWLVLGTANFTPPLTASNTHILWEVIAFKPGMQTCKWCPSVPLKYINVRKLQDIAKCSDACLLNFQLKSQERLTFKWKKKQKLSTNFLFSFKSSNAFIALIVTYCTFTISFGKSIFSRVDSNKGLTSWISVMQFLLFAPWNFYWFSLKNSSVAVSAGTRFTQTEEKKKWIRKNCRGF